MAGRRDQTAYLSSEYFDAHLTERGWRQAHALRDHIAALPEPLRVEAVIVSPLSRALETAAGAFGGGTWRSASEGPLLMAGLESEPVRQGLRNSLRVACSACTCMLRSFTKCHGTAGNSVRSSRSMQSVDSLRYQSVSVGRFSRRIMYADALPLSCPLSAAWMGWPAFYAGNFPPITCFPVSSS